MSREVRGFRGFWPLDFLFTPSFQPHVERRVETKTENYQDERVFHYGVCPKDRAPLRKRESRVFCKRCGFTIKRALFYKEAKK